ncbi:uncharacterized protein NECHADRAFT_75428 [Fusarium vanettenii 77-13-4]|uniref:Uncharacterized protein n=1 Tax=Fusarium vanettenii (strain ATCC MYA-4622 / CBS 123669 / FGSC 9596 / NRRL 45880 / 77-13-4) TaxID=660122 RepID=C7YIS6_FUSV7|nr:uncharacterized protein NECHADRAFT_75428 [Fusarium vanettenii 77-13-4]EEU48857.1 predicted protein [Fusarium vanettenii 77-13-4]
MGVFLAYFPTWLKFHELFRLGAYIHPFDFISSVYTRDLWASDRYKVYGGSWEAEFGSLKDFEDPFAFLTPAMQEGSALGGPFLPLECTLSEVHHRMGLGSIWTIGLPLMPAPIEENGKKSCYRVYAFPKHWEKEILFRFGYTLPRTSLATMASVTTPISEDIITRGWRGISSHIDRRHGRVAYHIGTKLGTPTGKMHPGWTTHLPGKDGLLCKRYGCHDLTKTQLGPTVTGPVSQDAISMNDNGSHPQNLSPTRSLTSNWPQVRFGSPIDLAEVDSADVTRWSPVDIKPDSFEARIVPGVPVEVHGPPVSAQPSQLLHATLKRRATDDLYHPGTPKKMKTAAETHLNLEGLDANDTCRLMGHAHEEVLGVATIAGLFDPTHFEVGPSGTIGLTESGLLAVADSKAARGGNSEALQNWIRRKCALMVAEVRHRVDCGGFWRDGHTSLLPLKNLLNGGQEISPGEVVQCISRIYEQIADSLEDLLETAKTLKSQRHEPMTEETKTAVMRALNTLYSQHEVGRLSSATRLRVANTLPGRPRLEMAQYLVGIATNYLDPVVFNDGAMKRVKPLEDKLQLVRSLRQRR